MKTEDQTEDQPQVATSAVVCDGWEYVTNPPPGYCWHEFLAVDGHWITWEEVGTDQDGPPDSAKPFQVRREIESSHTPQRRHRRTSARKIMDKPQDPEATETAKTTSVPAVDLPRLVLPSQLKFSVDPMWPERSNWFDRWIARKTAARILNGKSSSYQFGGPIGAKYPQSYVLVDARKEQLAQCILRAVGYACCTADIMAITGYDPEFRQNAKHIDRHE